MLFLSSPLFSSLFLLGGIDAGRGSEHNFDKGALSRLSQTVGLILVKRLYLLAFA